MSPSDTLISFNSFTIPPFQLMNTRTNSKTAHATQVEPVRFADVRNTNQRCVAVDATQHCAHPVPVKHQFSDSSHCATAAACRFCGRHLKRKNFVQQSASRVAVQS